MYSEERVLDFIDKISNKFLKSVFLTLYKTLLYLERSNLTSLSIAEKNRSSLFFFFFGTSNP